MPALPPRRESTTAAGPSQEPVAPKIPTRESSYGQPRKPFGTVVDSDTVSNLRSSLKKTPSSPTSTEPATPARLNIQDARAASGIMQKYKTDPNSLSLRDAKTGLTMANKILPPTTDKSPPNRQDVATAASITQKWNKDPKSLGMSDLKAGYAVANKFRPAPAQAPSDVPTEIEATAERNGVKDLRSRFANVALGGMEPPPKLQAEKNNQVGSTSEISPSPPAQKKRPPPPPPKPRTSTPTSPTAQPSPNLATKPKPPKSVRSGID